MPTPLAVLLAFAGAAWGLGADRIAARWPAHDDGTARAPGWRTVVTVAVGAVALGTVPALFRDPVPAILFGAYLAALVLLLATDLDQRLLPDVVTLPAIPIALVVGLAGLNPLVPPGGVLVGLAAALVLDVVLFVLAIPFGDGAIGQGDLKLLLSAGMVLGAWGLINAVVYAAFSAGVVIVVLLVTRRITLRSYIPYGPFLILGVIGALLAGR